MKKSPTNESSEYPSITVKWADHWENDEDGVPLEEAISVLQEDAFMGEFSGKLLGETFPKLKTKGMLCITSNIWEDGTCTRPMYIMKQSITYRSDRDASKEEA